MADKVLRKKRVSSGVRKNRAGKNCKRKGPAIMLPAVANFLKHQKGNRHADVATMEKAWELIKVKQVRNRASVRNKIRPALQTGTTLFDACMESNPAAVKTLLLAACLKVKRVKRYPGWYLERVYNLKNRVIEII